MSRSYDGGLTWSGAFLPGSAIRRIARLIGLTGSTVSRRPPTRSPCAAPCGQFYTVFVAFTRGGQSKLAVARYEDLNNDPGGDTIVYKGTTVVDTGNNANFGHFLDKPHINVDVFRDGGSKNTLENVDISLDGASKKKPKPPSGGNDDPCAHRVYVSYSTFTGKPKPGKFQSKVNFAVSEDGGLSFSKKKINKNFGQNQGSAIAVDPREGTPTTTGGGTVYTFWRHFNEPDSIIMTKSTNYGSSWSKPKEIIGSQDLVKFDQPTISTDAAIEFGLFGDTGLPEVAFRSNAFPTATAAVDPDSNGAEATVFVAWQERVGPDGYPLEGGTPRIVMMRSDNDGATWTDTAGVPGQRRAVDYLDRDQTGDPTVPRARIRRVAATSILGPSGDARPVVWRRPAAAGLFRGSRPYRRLSGRDDCGRRQRQPPDRVHHRIRPTSRFPSRTAEPGDRRTPVLRPGIALPPEGRRRPYRRDPGGRGADQSPVRAGPLPSSIRDRRSTRVCAR